MSISTALASRSLGTIVGVSLVMSMLIVLYYDLRVRRKGFDLEAGLQLSEAGDANGQI